MRETCTRIKTENHLCDIPWRVYSFIEGDLKKKRRERGAEVRCIWETQESQTFWDPQVIRSFLQTSPSCIFLPSPESRAPGLTGSRLYRCSLGNKVPADCCLRLHLGPHQDGDMSGDSSSQHLFWKPAYRVSRPLHSADDFRVSNCFKFFRQTEQKPFLVHPDYLNVALGPSLGALGASWLQN